MIKKFFYFSVLSGVLVLFTNMSPVNIAQLNSMVSSKDKQEEVRVDEAEYRIVGNKNTALAKYLEKKTGKSQKVKKEVFYDAKSGLYYFEGRSYVVLKNKYVRYDATNYYTVDGMRVFYDPKAHAGKYKKKQSLNEELASSDSGAEMLGALQKNRLSAYSASNTAKLMETLKKAKRNNRLRNQMLNEVVNSDQ